MQTVEKMKEEDGIKKAKENEMLLKERKEDKISEFKILGGAKKEVKDGETNGTNNIH